MTARLSTVIVLSFRREQLDRAPPSKIKYILQSKNSNQKISIQAVTAVHVPMSDRPRRNPTLNHIKASDNEPGHNHLI
jgi:hypothetical protein